MILTGKLKNKDGKTIAVGEWEALTKFLDEMKRLNPKHFNKRDFKIEVEAPTKNEIKQCGLVMFVELGNELKIMQTEIENDT